MIKVRLNPARGLRANCGTKDGRDYAFVTVNGTCEDGKPAHVTFNNSELYNGILAGRNVFDTVTVEGDAKPHNFIGRDGSTVTIMQLRDPMPIDVVTSKFASPHVVPTWDELMATVATRVSKVTEADNEAF